VNVSQIFELQIAPPVQLEWRKDFWDDLSLVLGRKHKTSARKSGSPETIHFDLVFTYKLIFGFIDLDMSVRRDESWPSNHQYKLFFHSGFQM